MSHTPSGRARADLQHLRTRIGCPAGQGTVEYVALILLVAGVLAGVIAAAGGLKGGGIAQAVVAQDEDRGRAGRQGRGLGRARGYPAGVPGSSDPRERPIAVFDSGVGGLTVLHELLVPLPHEDFVYLGDTARFPYGDRSREDLERFSLADRRRAAAPGARSCSSSPATRRPPRRCPRCRPACAQTTLGVDVLGVVRPEAVQAVDGDAQRADRAARDAGDGRERRLRRARSHAADPHVELVVGRRPGARADHPGAASRSTSDVVDDRARVRSRRCARRDVDTVILGCTHYPLDPPDAPAHARAATSRSSRPAPPLARQVEHALGSRGLASTRDG